MWLTFMLAINASIISCYHKCTSVRLQQLKYLDQVCLNTNNIKHNLLAFYELMFGSVYILKLVTHTILRQTCDFSSTLLDGWRRFCAFTKIESGLETCNNMQII